VSRATTARSAADDVGVATDAEDLVAGVVQRVDEQPDVMPVVPGRGS